MYLYKRIILWLKAWTEACHKINSTSPLEEDPITITHAAKGAETYYSTHRRMHGGDSGGCRCNLDSTEKKLRPLISSANAFFAVVTSSDSVSFRVSSPFFSSCADMGCLRTEKGLFNFRVGGWSIWIVVLGLDFQRQSFLCSCNFVRLCVV
jgi:hypothetical protein